jgi:hypothetical protein
MDRSKYVDIMVNEYVAENQLIKTAWQVFFLFVPLYP